MKILQIIPYFNPRRGGDVNVCYHLSKHLVKRGHDVTIFTTDFEFDETYANSLTDVCVVPFHCSANIALFLYTPQMKKRLRKEIKNFDIVHLHDFRTYQNVLVHRYVKRYGVPFVIQAHGDVPILTEKQFLKNIYDILWGKNILKDASKTFALNQTEVDQYRNYGVKSSDIKVVPNGIDVSEYNDLPQYGTFRRKYNIKDNVKIILYVGRIHESKGIQLLVEAFADTIKKLNNVYLVFVGPDDGYQQKLCQRINKLNLKNKILFTGFVDSQEKKSAFVDSDVFVTPRFYGFPITFLEACICGVPIITTNNGDKIDWIDDNMGFIVEYEKDKLQNAIFNVISDIKLKQKFSNTGKRVVISDFTWEKLIEKIEHIYFDIKRI
jgi:glycosyltransferase involved in cell wall biosynthesis